jgi:hypothetical protein
MKTIKIKVKTPIKVAYGHMSHISGTGVHGDKRLKRNNTRSNQNVKIRADWEIH